MSIYATLGALELGLIYGFVALGVAITFRILDFPDLTVDGSFPLGAAVCATCIVLGFNPWLSIIPAFIAGCIAGSLTAYLNVKFNILHLLASILVMIALYSINLRIMGKPNIALIGEATIMDSFPDILEPRYLRIIIMLCFSFCAYIITTRIILSSFGLSLRATGNNPNMARALGINVKRNIILGVAFSNGLVAIGGALFSQLNGFADVTLGTGTIVIGLASVIIGQSFFPNTSMPVFLLAVITGSVLYRMAVALALDIDFLGLNAADLNFVTAALVTLALIVTYMKRKKM